MISLLFLPLALATVVRVAAPPIPADGVTATTVYIHGDELVGAKPKVKADAGKVSDVVLLEGGLAQFTYVPPALTSPQMVPIKVTVGGAETTLQIPVVPPVSGGLSLSFDPPVLTATTTATVRIQPTGSSGVSNEGRRFLLTASVGTVDSPVPAGDGTWIARYTPPKGMLNPALVVFTAADAAFPGEIAGASTLAITTSKALSYDAPAGAQCILYIGDRSYGPFAASSAGKVSYTVDLDPREKTARLQIVRADGSREEKVVDLPVATTPQVAFLPTPATVRAGARVPLHLVALDERGLPQTAQPPTLTASNGGTVDIPVVANGRFDFTLTAPSTPGEVLVSATINGIKAERKLRVVAAPPRLSLSSDPSLLDGKTTTVQVVAHYKDAAGTAVVGRTPQFFAEGAALYGTPKDNKDGTYTTSWKLSSGADELRIVSVPALDVSGLAPARLVVWPSSSSVVTGGAVTVVILAVDAYGLPVADLDLRTGVPVGDGSLAPTVRTDKSGVARITYKAGVKAGPVTLHFEGGGVMGEAPLFQVTSGGAGLPIGGGPSATAALETWQGAIGTLTVGKAAPAPVPVYAPVPTASAPVAGTPGATPTATPGVTPSATPGATPGATASPRPAPTPGEAAKLRFGAWLTDARGDMSYDATPPFKDGLIGSASYSTPGAGFVGLSVDALYWLVNADFGSIGIEGDVGGRLQGFRLMDDPVLSLQRDVAIGARYRYHMGALGFDGGLGFHHTNAALFEYANEALTEVSPIGLSLNGARLSAGVALELGRVYATAEIAESFLPFPVATRLGTDLEVRVTDSISGRAMFAYDIRSMNFDTDGNGEGDTRAKQNLMIVGLGAGMVY